MGLKLGCCEIPLEKSKQMSFFTVLSKMKSPFDKSQLNDELVLLGDNP